MGMGISMLGEWEWEWLYGNGREWGSERHSRTPLLCTLSGQNVLVKYADDTNLLVPSDSDTELVDEFVNVKAWASYNKMIIRLLKTKEIVFRRPNPKLVMYPPPLEQIERVSNAKLLGDTLNENLRFDIHINNVLKICSQRFYLFKTFARPGFT